MRGSVISNLDFLSLIFSFLRPRERVAFGLIDKAASVSYWLLLLADQGVEHRIVCDLTWEQQRILCRALAVQSLFVWQHRPSIEEMEFNQKLAEQYAKYNRFPDLLENRVEELRLVAAAGDLSRVQDLGGGLQITDWHAKIESKFGYPFRVTGLAFFSGNLDFIYWVYKQLNLRVNWDKYKRVLLNYAVCGGHIRVFKWLVAEGFDVSSAKEIAAFFGQQKVLRWLMDRYEDASASSYLLLMRSAATNGQYETVAMLMKVAPEEVRSEKSLMFSAVCSGDFVTVCWVAKCIPGSIYHQHSDGSTSIHLAAVCGNEAVLRYLCEQAPDLIHVAAGDAATVLDYAANTKKVETRLAMLKWLYATYFPEKKHWQNIRFVNRVIEKTDSAVLAWLEEQGLVLFLPDASFKYLETAVIANNVETFDYLFRKLPLGLSVVELQALALLAVQCKCLDVLKRLKELGCDLNFDYENAEPNLLLHQAALVGAEEIIDWLTQNGVDIHATDKAAAIAMHWAAHGGYIPTLNYLEDLGLDPLAVNGAGEGIADYAKEAHFDAVESWLAEKPSRAALARH